MKNALLIAEKPSLMRAIKVAYDNNRSEFSDKIDFLSQAGHIIGLKTPAEVDIKYKKWDIEPLPFNFPYEYKINAGKDDLIKNIKNALKSGNYDYIIHAGDPDSEGELLITETLEYLDNTLPVKRFWSNDITEVAVVKALKNLKDDEEYKPLYEAALTRQHIDYQIGMNASRSISIRLGGLCKIGRVKAAIISTIVQREFEIENYVEKRTYKPAFSYKDCNFVFDKAFESEAEVLAYLQKTNQAIVKDVSVKTKGQKAPKLFKLSSLQIESHKQLRWSAQKTLSILQGLYEKKVVSYPRSACEYISTNVDIGSIAKNIIRQRAIAINIQDLSKNPEDILKDKTYCNDKAIASEGHTAIIPTGESPSSSLTEDETSLYEIICRRYLAMFASEKVTKTRKVSAVPEGSDDDYEFSETSDINAGYEVVLNPHYNLRTASSTEFKEGQVINPIEFFSKECVTQPPKRYNDGSIIKFLDNPTAYDGEDCKIKYKIGTEATRANIIEECQKNDYFTKQKGSFYATDKAKIVYSTYKDLPLFDIQESGKWEELLEQVRQNKNSAKKVEDYLLSEMNDTVNLIKELVPDVRLENSKSTAIAKCPKCGGDIINGKFGPFCTQKCGITLGKVYGKPITVKELTSLLSGKRTLIKNLTNKKGNKYDAYLTINGFSSFEYNGKTMYSPKYDMDFSK